MGALTWYYEGTDLTMLNVGYAELDERDGLFLDEVKDQFDRYRFQLYHHIVMRLGGLTDMEGKTLLETGCGRGGGLNYLASALKPQYAIGMTQSQFEVNFNKRTWPAKLNFLMGDSERITSMVPSNSIDYVVDIESSFFYPDKEAFLREVSLVLKDDGQFFFGSLIPANRLGCMENWIKKYFTIERQEDITDNIVRSLKQDTPHVNRFLDEKFPFLARFFLKQGWGLEGTPIHRIIENRGIVYKTYVLKKLQKED